MKAVLKDSRPLPPTTRSLSRTIYPETLKLLQRIYRCSRHHEVRQRAQCLMLAHQGYSVSELVTVFQVSRKTLYQWLKAWNIRGFPGLYRRPGQGRKATFTASQQAQIRQWAQGHPKQLKQVLHKIHEQWGVSVSLKTVKRVLKALRLS
jgi:transposase